QAIADYGTLFQMALDLPPRGFNLYLKSQTELGSVIALVRQHELDAALALAQRGDVARSNMYDWVLVSAARQWPLARTAALVQECAQSGSFPYQAALALPNPRTAIPSRAINCCAAFIRRRRRRLTSSTLASPAASRRWPAATSSRPSSMRNWNPA